MSLTGLPIRSRVPATPLALVCTVLLILLFGPGGPLEAQPAPLTLLKTGTLDVGSDGLATPGDVIDYTFTIGNNSSPGECGDITGLVVTDTLLGAIDCGPTPVTVPPGQLECFASYPITQDDIDAGAVYNQATAEGLVGCEVTEQVMDDHLEPIEQVASIELAKTGTLDMGGDGMATPGDLITYSLTPTNSGNVTLTTVTLTDSELASFDCTGGVHPIPSLAPGASETCTGTYAITQADIDAGFKDNTADVTAQEPIQPQDAPISPRQVASQTTAQVMIPQQPTVDIAKSGVLDMGANGVADPGDLINYTFQVGNPGNVTLTSVAITDPLVGPISCPGGNPIPTLAPAASVMCTGSYALTAGDITAGSVTNTAGADGMDPMANPVSAGDSATLALPRPMPTAGPIGLVALGVALVGAAALVLRRRRAIG